MRRFHVPTLSLGRITLDSAQSHHARSVLRIEPGDTVEIFDAGGRSAIGRIKRSDPTLIVEISQITESSATIGITIASAVPKGDRADWLVEKLSEIGVSRWIPLRTTHSVVHPEGEKTKRWDRIAVEATKQSRRVGVMTIDPLTNLNVLLSGIDPATTFVMSTRDGVVIAPVAMAKHHPSILLIGPEGGWDDAEEADFQSRGLTRVGLGPTILRIETAAILAAGLIRLLTTS